MFNFEKLSVWKKAVDFADRIYDLTAIFPSEERFGLTAQMRQAAVSISANIAEGCSRVSPNDYARFLEIATGSVFETLSESIIARRRSYLIEPASTEIYQRAEELSKMLSSLRYSILNPPKAARKLSTLNPQL